MTKTQIKKAEGAAKAVRYLADVRNFAGAFATIADNRDALKALFQYESVYGYDFFADWLKALDAECAEGWRSRNVADFVSLAD